MRATAWGLRQSSIENDRTTRRARTWRHTSRAFLVAATGDRAHALALLQTMPTPWANQAARCKPTCHDQCDLENDSPLLFASDTAPGQSHDSPGQNQAYLPRF